MLHLNSEHLVNQKFQPRTNFQRGPLPHSHCSILALSVSIEKYSYIVSRILGFLAGSESEYEELSDNDDDWANILVGGGLLVIFTF